MTLAQRFYSACTYMYILISRKLDSTKPRHLARRWHSVCLFFPLVHLVFRVFILYAFSRLVMHPAGSSYAQFECWWMKNFVERISSKDRVSEWSRNSRIKSPDRVSHLWSSFVSGAKGEFISGTSANFRIQVLAQSSIEVIAPVFGCTEWAILRID